MLVRAATRLSVSIRNVVTVPDLAASPTASLALPESVRVYQRSALAANTVAAYDADWRRFESWCKSGRLRALPAEPATVATYLASVARLVTDQGKPAYSPATLGRWVAGINKVHSLAGLQPPGSHPVVATTLDGIRRTHHRPPRRKRPLLTDPLRDVLNAIEIRKFPEAVIGRRDRLILLLGMPTASRRSEIVALTRGDVRVDPHDGLHVEIRRSKTDQTGKGGIKAVPYGIERITCAPCAFVSWLELVAAWDTDGRTGILRVLLNGNQVDDRHVCRDAIPDVDPESALIRSVTKHGTIGAGGVTGHVVNAVVKRRLAAIGVDPTEYGGHSLRSGMVTQAILNGATPTEAMAQSWHTSEAQLRVYVRTNTPLVGNAVTKLGL